jgi:DUF1365 family protein
VTESAIYSGHVRHRRFAVRNHEFRYPLTMAYIDLDELPALLGGRLTKRRPGLVRFRRQDYLGEGPLGEAVRRTVEERVGRKPEGPIRLLTHLRTLGHCFNPVSFYYCFEPDGRTLHSIVAEVTNTPWGERHAYVLEAGNRTVNQADFDKALHVSPFMPMDQRYTWRAPAPGDTLSVHIESTQQGERAFDATLNLTRRPLSTRGLAKPTFRLLALIYGHAVALKLKGVPVQPHPAR